ncbi:tetratricopeptide repeat protein [Vicingaceae bacterium]|nr:tetratricopeptide repeat protein [Vicingaceae bacterium]
MGVFVLGLLYCVPRQESEITEKSNSVETEESHEGHDHAEGEGHDHEHEGEFEDRLNDSDKEFIAGLEKRAKQIADVDTKLNLYDSLMTFSIKRNVPPLVAKYTEEKAKVVPTEVNFMLAGDNFFKAFRLSKLKPKDLVEGAIHNYEKVLELNPDNLQAQTAIGVASVEGSSQLGIMPMKGIGILKDVLNKDSKNVDAMTNLGYFAIQSGQFEKAVERFEEVLFIDPNNAEAYIYLTDAYLSQDKVDKGIETLEKYKLLVDDPIVIKQVEDYINEIRNKN